MKTRNSRFDRIADIAGVDGLYPDAPDLWGSARGMFFDVASVLDMSDVDGDVSPQPFARWQYRRAPFTVPSVETVASRGDDFHEGEWADDYTYGQIALAIAYRDGEITQSDLIYAGDILHRYTALLRRNGKDY